MTELNPISYNSQEHGPLDGTYGYDDVLLTHNAREIPHRIQSLAGSDIDAIVRNHDPITLETLAQLSWISERDQLFQLENGALVIRRSIFSEPCPSDLYRSSHVLELSENEARALAYFSNTDGGGTNNGGAEWCGGIAEGREYGELLPIQTPWALQGYDAAEGLRALQVALENIREAQEHPDQLNGQAQELASRFSEDRLSVLLAEVERRLEEVAPPDPFGVKEILFTIIGVGLISFGIGAPVGNDLYSSIKRGIRNSSLTLASRRWAVAIKRGIRNLLRNDDNNDGPPTSGSATTVDGAEAAAPVEALATAEAPAEVPVEAPEVAPAMDLLGNAQAFTQFYGEQGISPQAVSTMTTVPGVSIALTPGVVPYAAPMVAPEAPMPTINLKMPSFAPAPRLAPPALRPVF